MGADTKIEWTDHTFNGWIGCTRYGVGCTHCYAEAQNKHWKWNGGEWGPGALRKVTSPSKWREPLKWNREAEEAGVRRKVFAFSLGDWADKEGPLEALPYLWELWRLTPWLDWQMLTKRAERIAECLPPDWGTGYPNVWLGYSVACQDDADRGVPQLLRVPAVVHFLSCEPLIESVTLQGSNIPEDPCGPWPEGQLHSRRYLRGITGDERINWVIVGGESGGHARSMQLEWTRSLIDQCRAAGVAPFFKQAGVKPTNACGIVPLTFDKKHGGDPRDWPGGAEAWPREFPVVRNAEVIGGR